MQCRKYVYFLILLTLSPQIQASNRANIQELGEIYNQYCTSPSDIFEHLPPLCKLASECSSVAEIGVRSVVSTWALIKGLSDAQKAGLFYLGIDLAQPPADRWQKAASLARDSGISFHFWQANDMTIDLPAVDFLFIDSLHTYCHLTYELEKFSPKVHKYIALHDTSAPWGDLDDSTYTGDYSEYSPWIDRSKRGLWPAVVDFLARHPEWSLLERRLNCHGFTVLRRIK